MTTTTVQPTSRQHKIDTEVQSIFRRLSIDTDTVPAAIRQAAEMVATFAIDEEEAGR